MRRLVVGGALCLIVGMAFVIGGIASGNWGRVGFGGFGVLMGAGSLLGYRIESDERGR
jgi:hypothetical protein